MTEKIVPVILCGGSGTRLWPESRESHPKQFIRLLDGLSLLQETASRAQRVLSENLAGLVAVTTSSLADKVSFHLSSVRQDFRQHVLREPHARSTAAAIAYAAIYVREVFGPDALMWVLPSDHHIGDEDELAEAVSAGVAAAKDGHLVAFGIHPYRPETGYGYIRAGERVCSGTYLVDSFVEKPDEKTAKSFIDSGRYLWNSGMFLFSAEKILEGYELHAPDISDKVRKSIKNSGNINEIATDIYEQIPEQGFDKAIMENARNVAVIPCDPGWSDIGSWQSFWELQEKDGNGNAIKGKAVCHETSNCLIQAGSRLVACAGLENIAVIDTPDALLIVNREDGNAIRALINIMKEKGYTEVREKMKRHGIRSGMPDYSHNTPQIHTRENLTVEEGRQA